MARRPQGARAPYRRVSRVRSSPLTKSERAPDEPFTGTVAIWWCYFQDVGMDAFGGPALFLLAQGSFPRQALGRTPRSFPSGIASLAILAVATAPITLLAGIAASSAAVAVADTADP